MARGLYRDQYGWVEVDYDAAQSPMPAENYISGGHQPPYETLPTIAPPSPTRINNSDHWRSRSEETRLIAELMIDQTAIATMLKVAAQYNELAVRAEWRRLAESQVRLARERYNRPSARRSARPYMLGWRGFVNSQVTV
jgi:hypothetical protein